MRILLTILTALFVVPAFANIDKLIALVKKDDTAAVEAYFARRAKEIGQPYPVAHMRDSRKIRALFYARTSEMLTVLIANGADGATVSVEDLVEAIKANNLFLAREIIRLNPALINTNHEQGRTPIFYAWTPEMLELLLANDATLSDYFTRTFIDADGNNVLHFLLGVTAHELLGHAAENELNEIAAQIRATALLLVRTNVIDTMYNPDAAILEQRNHNNRRPFNEIPERLWTPDFVQRMTGAHIHEHRQPVPGGAAGILERKKARLAELDRQERQRQIREDHARRDAELIRRHQAQEEERARVRAMQPPEQTQTVVVLTLSLTHYPDGRPRSRPQFAMNSNAF